VATGDPAIRPQAAGQAQALTRSLFASYHGASCAPAATRRSRALAIVRPILDFTRSMPSFVDLIPVVALFGAKGLGEDVLEALQHASEGQGIFAGLAILCCALILDRIVQGQRKG
jgi:ABC-type proline/glycine betaine transport system permease subunit